MTNCAPDRSPAPALIRVIAAVVAASAVAAADRLPAVSGSADERAVVCEVAPPRETAALEQCLQWSPRDVESLLDLASTHESAGRTTEAIEVYRRAVELDPLDAEGRLALAKALFASGQDEAARLEARRAASLRPGDPEAHRLASIAAAAGDR